VPFTVVPEVFEFEGFTLDLTRGCLRAGDRPIELRPKSFDVLRHLLKNPGRLVSKDELVKTIWPGIFVEDGALTHCVSEVRRALGDHSRRMIKTVPRRGYLFVAPVSLRTAGALSAPLTTSVSPSAEAPRLSIIVLAFANLSNDPEQGYFADGITEDVTTDLSRIAGMFVISRNTAFTYRNKPVDTRQIGRELGVRYVLEGSVRRSGGRVRVHALLIDATTDEQLWAERFERDMADLFALQDEITSRIANALDAELIAVEAARPSEHPDAFDYILRGRAVRLKPNSLNVYPEAISLFERALMLDPQSVEAQSLLAGALVSRVMNGLANSPREDLVRGEYLVDQALAASPNNAYAHFVKGEVLRAGGHFEEALPEYRTALESNRNLMPALTGLGWCKLYTGSIEAVVPLAEQAIRLSPRDPAIGSCYYLIGTVHLLQSHTREAIDWLEKARSAMPAVAFQRSRLASAYALIGETRRAAGELAEARKLDPGELFSSIARLRAFPGAWWGVPKIRALYEATYFAGLRKAGMPET